MEALFDGTLAGYWNDSLLPLGGFCIATLAVLIMLGRTATGMVRLCLRTLGVLTLLATIPLAMDKAGIGISIANRETVVFLSITGSTIALAALVIALTLPRRLAKAFPITEMYSQKGNIPVKESDPITIHSSAIPSSVPQAALTIVSGNAVKNVTNELGNASVLSIGRSQDNDIIIDEPTVSRRHATVSYQNGTATVQDLNSANGVLVNGEKVQQVVLQPGSKIRLGNSELVFDERKVSEEKVQANVSVENNGAVGETGIREPQNTVVQQRKPITRGWLVIRSGPQQGDSYTLSESSYTIGRGHHNDIAITDPGISRSHALLNHRDGSFFLYDAGSTAGTWINGEKVSGSNWEKGSALQVGETILTLVGHQQQMPQNAEDTDTTVYGTYQGSGATIIVQSGADAAKTYSLRQGNNVIGRATSSDVMLTDDTVSRLHCIVRLEDGKASVFDMGSAAGTIVSGRAILAGNRLTSGDKITLGSTTTEFIEISKS
jgi:pSer/pThr/pTyr-binding forkhead associated (FHA) protein